MKFNVGDKVRVTMKHDEGVEGVIEEINTNNSAPVLLRVTKDERFNKYEGKTLEYFFSSLELIKPAIKHGDPVRVVDSEPYEGGIEGTVLISKPDNGDDLLILVTKTNSRGFYLGKVLSYKAEHLELRKPVEDLFYNTALDGFLFSV